MRIISSDFCTDVNYDNVTLKILYTTANSYILYARDSAGFDYDLGFFKERKDAEHILADIHVAYMDDAKIYLIGDDKHHE